MQQSVNKMGVRPIFPLLMSMAFPPIVSMWIQSLYNIVDSMFVARYSEDALTAVSLAFPVQNLLLAVAVGTGVGLNSYIARQLGEGKREEAGRTAAHGILLAVVNGLIFVVLGLLLVKPFFRLFTSDADIYAMGCQYTSIVTLLSIGMQVHIAIEKILQSTGKMLFPMFMQAFGAIVNIILDPIMIFGLFGFPRMGAAGAALATVIGQMSAMLMSILVLWLGRHEVTVSFRHFRLDWSTVKQIYIVGFPSILMNSLGSLLVTGLNRILVGFSNTAVSVYGVVFKLQTFIYMPASGLIQGAMPIMGYNYGAQNRKRLLKTLRCSLLVTVFIMAAGNLLFVLCPQWLLSLFDASGEMSAIGVPALRIISCSYIPAAFCVIFSTLFQAMGKGGYSLVVFLSRQLLIPLPSAFLLAGVVGLYGVWLAFPIAEVLSAVIAFGLLSFVMRRDPVLHRGND